MTDKCSTPDCHEAMKLCIHKMLPRKTMWTICWALFVVIVIPLGVTGVNVWSKQASDELRYATKTDVVSARQTQIVIQKDIEHIKADLKELMENQSESSKDTKDILKYLRDKK
jgi:predicted PurR-regulated permease PerM